MKRTFALWIAFFSLVLCCAQKNVVYTKNVSVKKLTKMAQKGDPVSQFQLGNDYYWGHITGKRDYVTARKWLAMAAANGNGDAQVYLGRIYRYGRDVKKNLQTAYSLYKQAEANGVMEVYYDLGGMFIDEGIPTKDPSKGMELLLKAADAGSLLAQEDLATYYFNGTDFQKQDLQKALRWARKGIEQNSGLCYTIYGYICSIDTELGKADTQKAFDAFKKGADLGEASSEYFLAWWYRNKKDREYEDSLSFIHWLKKSADDGSIVAQSELASHFYEYATTKEDSLNAIYYGEQAAEAGDVSAFVTMGCIYHSGFATEEDKQKALDYFRKGAEKGNSSALYNMGLYYEFGYGGLKKDVFEAYRYYGESLQNGYKGAKTRINNMPERGTAEAQELSRQADAITNSFRDGTQKETPELLKKRFDLWMKAAEKGNAYAQANIGDCFYFGQNGAQKDYLRAKEWYEKSIENGNRWGMCNLANIYHNGYGVERNQEKAFRLFYLDALMGNDVDQYNTGLYYQYGWLGHDSLNLEKAKHWYQLAASQGYEMAKKKLEDLEHRLVGSTEIGVAEETASHQTKQRRIALVVGNAAYKPTPLRNSKNDADDLKRKLELLDFDVTFLSNATKLGLDTCVSKFTEQAKNYDVAFFFYSGHGIQIDGQNYLLPVDINMNLKPEYAGDMCSSLSEILSKMERSKCPMKIVVIDACRDNPLEKTSYRGAAYGGLAKVDNVPDGMFLAFSTGAGKRASDGKPGSRNSPFASALLSLIDKPDLEIDQLFKRVGKKVMEETGREQTPWRHSTTTEDFYFNQKSEGIVK